MGNDDGKYAEIHLREAEEGPFYKENSPLRQNIAGDNTFGEKLTIEGRVLDLKGAPVPGAWLDFWQADGKGLYDNEGYDLRGYQYADEQGYFRLETVMPALYGNRTPHIHVKVRGNSVSKIYTAQLFFYGVESNEKDPIFEPANIMKPEKTPEGMKASFDLVIEVVR